MRDDARQAGIVEGRGRPSERPVLTISGSGEGGRKRGRTTVCFAKLKKELADKIHDWNDRHQ